MIATEVTFVAGGAIGIVVSVIHGILLQRKIIAPYLLEPSLETIPPALRLLIVLLLHSTTVAWLSIGMAVLAAPFFADPSGQRIIGGLAILNYAFAAFENGYATRWRHPGWVLLAIATVALAIGMATA